MRGNIKKDFVNSTKSLNNETFIDSSKNKINVHINEWPSYKAIIAGRLLDKDEIQQLQSYFSKIQGFAAQYSMLVATMNTMLEEEQSSPAP